LDKHPDRASVTKQSRAKIFLAFSIILHLVLVLLVSLSNPPLHPALPETPDEQVDGRLVFELIEVPDEIPEAPPDSEADLVSDRQARAADAYLEPLLKTDEPHATDRLEVERRDQRQVEALSGAQKDRWDDGGEGRQEREDDGRLADLLMSEPSVNYLDEMRADRNQQNSRRSIGYRNLLSRAERQGGMSFNTYNWDFAPYMLAMKRKVESNLRPPYAFTHMGAVSGTNIIRFVVMPSGRIQSLEVISSDAHFSLDQTSVRAIERSAPFLPLPKGFPEDVLEVTAHFAYIVDG
jgi:TonB family protein